MFLFFISYFRVVWDFLLAFSCFRGNMESLFLLNNTIFFFCGFIKITTDDDILPSFFLIYILFQSFRFSIN